jgi:RNA polymerase sigma-70 factor (ECF subfamily)
MDPGAQRDEDLMADVAGGRADLLEWLVHRHGTGLLTFLTRMVGDRHRAEELFQEVFLAVWLKRRQYQFPRPFRPWLYAIAVNRCRVDFRLRRRGAVALPDEHGPADPDSSPAEHAMAAETAEFVSQAITRLPPQQRMVVVLRTYQGLSYARIAQIAGCTEGTVRSHMHHGLVALRAELAPLVEAGARP